MLVITVIAAECGKLVSKETKIDILVTPGVTIFVGVGLAELIAPGIGAAALLLVLALILGGRKHRKKKKVAAAAANVNP